MIPHIDRRTFLHSTLATTAALAGRRCRGEKKPKLKLAVKYDMIHIDGSIEKKFELIKSLGFLGVEMNSPSDIDKDEAVKARDKTGIVIHGVIDSMHWQDTLSHPDEKVRAKGLAALKGASMTPSFTGPILPCSCPGSSTRTSPTNNAGNVPPPRCARRSHCRRNQRQDRHRSRVEQLHHQAGATRRIRRSVQDAVSSAHTSIAAT